MRGSIIILVTGHFRFPPDRLEQAKPAMRRIIAASLDEAGCRGYSYAEDLIEPGLFRVCEEWDSPEALKAHFESAHMQEWRIARERLGFRERDITQYRIARSEPL